MELSPRVEFCAQSVHSHVPRPKKEKEQAIDQGGLVLNIVDGLCVPAMRFSMDQSDGTYNS